MDNDNFPIVLVDAVTRFLDTIKYDDRNYKRDERICNLHHVYTNAAAYFAQPAQQQLIQARNTSPNSLQASLQTISAMIVSSWVHVDQDVMVDLTIHFTVIAMLDDDTTDQPAKTMGTFYEDLVQGNPQRHLWWQILNDHLPVLLRHYGPYCGLNIVRCTTNCEL
ncbi:uncharacterized protein PG998_014871 [Apiospora kogelbergensis]|uniref:uncharacterized protein n=1 Tax=Apiospora kogelbergensis TaxID=1337665 RepID=UPI00312EF521